jgi:purine-nucleoside/S-methyl-5'-thioadenosine phosphorylase / adenosine deaminase
MPEPLSKRRSPARAKSTVVPPIFPEMHSKSPETESKSDIEALDDLFQHAGLVRSRREKPAGLVRRARFQPATPEELSPVPPAPRVAPNGVQWLAVPAWERIPWLWHGFSTRRGGVSRAYCLEDAPAELNLGFTPDDQRENVLRNRELLAEALTGDHTTPLATVRQIHSNVLVVGGSASACSEPGKPLGRGDGLMTEQSGVLLGIQTADCIPVLVADRRRRAVAAFHAGWRGTVKRIVENGIGRMRLEFGSRPEDMVGAIGPGILACCYAVGEDVYSEFESQFTYGPELFREVYVTDPVRTKYPMLFLTQRAPGHSPIGPSLHVDLVEANRRQLLAAGLKPEAIQVVGACTNCHPELFFSHRGSRGRCGRMLSVIGIMAGNRGPRQSEAARAQ